MPHMPHPSSRVLVVDHDPTLRDTLSSPLRAEGYHVVERESPMPALSYLRAASEPHIVVLSRTPASRVLLDGFFLAVWADADLATRHRYLCRTAHPELVRPELIGVLRRLGVPLIACPFDEKAHLALVNTLAAHMQASSGSVPRP